MTMRKHTELIQQYVEDKVTLVDHVDLNLPDDRLKDTIFKYMASYGCKRNANARVLARKIREVATELNLNTFGFVGTAEGADYWDDVVRRLNAIATNLIKEASGA